MRESEKMKPVLRSKFRVWLGARYYRLKRYAEWRLSGDKLAKLRERNVLPHIIASHQSPMLRQLKDVDMWLQHNKITNLKLAMSRIDGLVLQPGETFSFWRQVGKPSRRKGYVDGMVLHYGKFKPGVGGGLCQLTNLLYWMALHSPLEVRERHRHSYDVFPDSKRTQPFGSGATCSYNYLDLKLYNPSDHPVQIHVFLDENNLAGELRSTRASLYRYEVYEREHRITREYWGGHVRHNLIYRRVYNLNSELIEDEYITENHALMMYEPLLEAGSASHAGAAAATSTED